MHPHVQEKKYFQQPALRYLWIRPDNVNEGGIPGP